MEWYGFWLELELLPGLLDYVVEDFIFETLHTKDIPLKKNLILQRYKEKRLSLVAGIEFGGDRKLRRQDGEKGYNICSGNFPLVEKRGR